MAHDHVGIPWDPKVQGMSSAWVLVDMECATGVIGDPGSVGSSFLAELRQGPNDPGLLATG